MFLNLDNIPPYYKNYVKQVDNSDLLTALRVSGFRTQEVIHGIPENQGDHTYAPGKWTIKVLVAHIIDAERIFCYRALRFARKDKTVLSPFDENSYAPNANAGSRTLKKLADELHHVRMTSIDLFESFNEEMMSQKGMVGQNEVSVLALGFIITGHETHHRNILRERYLTKS